MATASPNAQGGGQEDRSRTVQSVARAAELLKTLGKFPRPTSLSDLARRVGLSKPATFNLLRTLEHEGLIAKDEDARYRLSWGMYELGSAVGTSIDLPKLARFHLDRLAEKTGAAILLGILDQGTVLYLDRGQSADAFGMVANAGRRSPLHSNASGKVLLAAQSSQYIEGYIAKGLKAFTSNTITDGEALRADLDRVARRGYSTCWEEREIGLASISVPLRNRTNAVQAALTIAAPSTRLNRQSISRFLVPLQEEAEAISAKLGWIPAGQRQPSAGPHGE